MRIYYAFMPPAPTPNITKSLANVHIITDEFHWLAFLFGPLWAAFKGAWLVAFGFLSFNIFLGGLAVSLDVPEVWRHVAFLLIQIAFGFSGASLIMASRRFTGWVPLGAFTGTYNEAERHFINLIINRPQNITDRAPLEINTAPNPQSTAALTS